jgi:hypothetical protein
VICDPAGVLGARALSHVLSLAFAWQEPTCGADGVLVDVASLLGLALLDGVCSADGGSIIQGLALEPKAPLVIGCGFGPVAWTGAGKGAAVLFVELEELGCTARILRSASASSTFYSTRVK